MSGNFKVVGIVAKPSQPAALVAATQVMEYLSARDIQFRVDQESSERLSTPLSSELILPRSEIARQCPLIVVLGGDGTLISVAHYPAEPPPMIIGVNLGTLGFMTEIGLDELFVTLDLVLEGRAKVESRPLLEARFHSPAGRSGEDTSYYALNDVVISKETIARIFEVSLSVDGDLAANIRGDGIIVSTPTGSTGYNLAAGGSIVHPRVPALLVTPLCPHSLTSRPLVIPSTAELRIEVLAEETGRGNDVHLTIDGQSGQTLHGGDSVTIRNSAYSVQIVKSPSRNYYQLLSSKLKWANS